jgi:hypothetical protein
VRQGCGGKPTGGSVSVGSISGGVHRLAARSLFSYDLHLPTKDIIKRGKSLMRQRWGRCNYFSLLFFFLIRGFRFGGGIVPPRLFRHPGDTLGLPSLFPCPQLLIVGTIDFLLCRILG